MARKPGVRQRRHAMKANPYVPRLQDHVMAPSYLTNTHPDGEMFEAYVLQVSRPQGVMGATVRFLDKMFHSLPDGGMHWYPARELHPTGRSGRGGQSYMSSRPEPSGGARYMSRTVIDVEETSPTTTPTRRRRRRRRVSSTTLKARQRSMRAAAARSAEDAGTSSTENNSLQAEGKAAKLPAGRKRAKSGKPEVQSTTTRRTRMARRTAAKAAEAEAPAATTTRKRGRKSTTAAATPEPATNGSNRRTHEDIVALVPEIVKHLKNGVTMTEIRLGGDEVAKTGHPDGYGAGPVIRKALTEAGYNTKGEVIETPDLTELEGKPLADAVAELRDEGKAWYFLELATDMSQNDLKDLLEEHGYASLAEGRVIISGADEEEEEAPAPTARRGRKAAAATTEAAAPATTTRKRGRKAAAAEPEAEAAPATTTRRRGRKAAANPS